MTETLSTSATCATCGIRPRRTDPWGRLDERCDDCEAARVEEVNRIASHHELHPDECCCHTYLGRASCMAPAHGDQWRVNAISNGERFCYVIRADSRREAAAIGREMCQSNGEECVGVARLRPQP